MIRRTLLFPTSTYLETRWWHRLAIVIFWSWLAGVAVYLSNILILEPHSTCIRVKYMGPDGPSDLDCGSNPISYIFVQAAGESAGGIALALVVLAIACYMWAIIPGLVYRLFLFVAKGSTWRDGARSA